MTRGLGGTGGACRRLLALLAGASLLLLAPAGASAAPGLAPEDHAFPVPQTDTTGIDAAFAPNGYGAVAWIEVLSSGNSRVGVSLRPPGGDWSAPQFLGETSRSVNNVRVAVNDGGAAALGWGESMSPTTFVGDIATRPADGVFGAPETFDGGFGVAVGVDANGNVTTVYQIVNQTPSTLNGEFTRTFAAGGTFAAAAPETLGTTCRGLPQLAVAPSGDAVTGWDCSDVDFVIRRNGAWGTTTPAFVSDFVNCPGGGGGNLYYLGGVAMDGQGHATAVVLKDLENRDCSNPMFNQTTHSVLLAVPSGGALTAGPTVAQGDTSFGFFPPPNDVSGPTVGIGGGSVVVAWNQTTSNKTRPATRTYTGNGADAPGAVELLGAADVQNFGVRIAVGPASQALASWTSYPPSGTIVPQAAFRPAGGAFGTALPVSDGSADTNVVVNGLDAAGDGLIGFLEGPNAGPHVAHARGFDANPPQLSDVKIPATAPLGVAAAFSAQASDVWGPVAFAWDFGDGSATDASTTHAFGAPGQHAVTVTATDTAGATSQTATVSVQSPAPPLTIAAPFLSSVGLTNKTFRVGRRSTAIAARKRRRIPVGTTFRFSLDKAATMAITIDRALPGRRSGKRCVKPSKRLARSKRCTRFVRKARLTRNGKAGANRVGFSGRIRRRALAPGNYRVTFVATAGGKTGAAKSLRFKIVR